MAWNARAVAFRERSRVAIGSPAKTLARQTFTAASSIITRTGDVYQLQWKVGSGVINGIGFRIEDDFFVAWGGNSLGVVGYLFAGDRARGVWTHAGASATGSENLAR